MKHRCKVSFQPRIAIALKTRDTTQHESACTRTYVSTCCCDGHFCLALRTCILLRNVHLHGSPCGGSSGVARVSEQGRCLHSLMMSQHNPSVANCTIHVCMKYNTSNRMIEDTHKNLNKSRKDAVLATQALAVTRTICDGPMHDIR